MTKRRRRDKKCTGAGEKNRKVEKSFGRQEIFIQGHTSFDLQWRTTTHWREEDDDEPCIRSTCRRSETILNQYKIVWIVEMPWMPDQFHSGRMNDYLVGIKWFIASLSIEGKHYYHASRRCRLDSRYHFPSTIEGEGEKSDWYVDQSLHLVSIDLSNAPTHTFDERQCPKRMVWNTHRWYFV